MSYATLYPTPDSPITENCARYDTRLQDQLAEGLCTSRSTRCWKALPRRTLNTNHVRLSLTECYHFQAQEQEAYLARFDSSWATADMVKQFLRNRRKYAVRKGYILPRAQRVAQAVDRPATGDVGGNN